MKILILDIETAPHLVYSWGLYKQLIPVSNLVEPGYTMCWAAQFVGDKTMHQSNIFESTSEEMLGYINHLLNQADGVVTYNGDSFDLPQLNRGFVEAGLPRPSPYSKIDLYKSVKKHFKFASNKLDYVCQELGLARKLPSKGMKLWSDCMDGSEEAWAQMIDYNKQDVVITGQLYKHVLPWIDGHPNFALHEPTNGERICPKCGSHNLQSRGYQHTQTQSYRRYQCQDCHSWFRERFTAVKGGDRSLILTESK